MYLQALLLGEELNLAVVVSLTKEVGKEDSSPGDDAFLQGLVAPNPRLKTIGQSL